MDKTITGLWHLSPIQNSFVDIISVSLWRMMHVFVLFESGLLRTVMHVAYVGLRSSTCIVLTQLFLALLEI